MKTKSLPSVLLATALAGSIFSQSVKITPKTTTYRRPKAEDRYKRTFTIVYPRVTSLSASLNKRIENTVSYEKILDLDLKEELDGRWLEKASYEVNYNKRGILVITLTMEGSGAYPSCASKTVVVDMKAGNRLMAADLFSNLPGLAAICKRFQKAEVKRALADRKKGLDASFFQETDFKVENLDEFSVGDRGVTFIYDYGFPHVALALQPDGRYFFTWRQLRPYIKTGGLLHQFVR